ncbi:MAG: transglycosylase SLT domain-containing protein [Sulfuricaulis sp.]
MNTHPALGRYAQAIWTAANEFGVNPVAFSSMLNFENVKGDPNAVSSAGAIGLGQVEPGKTFEGHTVTAADLKNPSYNLRVAAWYLGQGLDKFGNYQDAYTQWYNPGASAQTTGVPFKDVPKGYVLVNLSPSPQQTANRSADVTAAKQTQPYIQSQAAKRLLDPIYMAYANRKASDAEVKGWLGQAGGDATMINTTQIERVLANPDSNPNIYRSPIWVTHYADYEDAYKKLFGPDVAVPRSALLFGIVHNLNTTAFAQMLRDGTVPGQSPYEGSQEFKGNVANATTVYQNIYGTPDANGQAFIQSAVKGGWNQAQLESYLRSRPEYTSSGEYKTRSIELAARMGLVPGGVGQTALAGAAVTPTLPPTLPTAPPAGPPPVAAPPPAAAPAGPPSTADPWFHPPGGK